jgi:hypothetical protein
MITTKVNIFLLLVIKLLVQKCTSEMLLAQLGGWRTWISLYFYFIPKQPLELVTHLFGFAKYFVLYWMQSTLFHINCDMEYSFRFVCINYGQRLDQAPARWCTADPNEQSTTSDYFLSTG